MVCQVSRSGTHRANTHYLTKYRPHQHPAAQRFTQMTAPCGCSYRRGRAYRRALCMTHAYVCLYGARRSRFDGTRCFVTVRRSSAAESGPTTSTTSQVPMTCPDPLSMRPMRPRVEVRDPRSSHVLRPERIASSQCFLMMSAFTRLTWSERVLSSRPLDEYCCIRVTGYYLATGSKNDSMPRHGPD